MIRGILNLHNILFSNVLCVAGVYWLESMGHSSRDSSNLESTSGDERVLTMEASANNSIRYCLLNYGSCMYFIKDEYKCVWATIKIGES